MLCSRLRKKFLKTKREESKKLYNKQRNLCMTLLRKGPYVKYVGREGGQRVFVGIMKYFRHILMGHEIFFKILDGPQNIFLCSFFVILFLS